MTTPEATPFHEQHADAAPERPELRSESLRRALRLEYLTLGWNLVEGLVGVAAALAAGSVAILGFGIDSFVECASALLWCGDSAPSGIIGWPVSGSRQSSDGLAGSSPRLSSCSPPT